MTYFSYLLLTYSGELHMSKYLLFTPGPVNVADNVRLAIAQKDICPRGWLIIKLKFYFNTPFKSEVRGIIIESKE